MGFLETIESVTEVVNFTEELLMENITMYQKNHKLVTE